MSTTEAARRNPLPDFPGYTTLDSEVVVDRLPVTGRVPEWLTGTLIRNGPARFEVGDYRMTHWFDGLAMLHSFSFTSGQVSYANRYLRSRSYEEGVGAGRLYGKPFGLDPCKKLFGRHFAKYSPNISDNTNINVVRIADRYFAFQDQPLYREFDPISLDTLGVASFENEIKGEISTPHPHFDFDQRVLVNYTTQMRDRTSYQVFYVPEGALEQRLLATVDVDEPCYMHTFAMTANYVVLVEFPVVIDTEKFVRSDKPFVECFTWQPTRPARFRVIDKRTGTVAKVFESEAFFAFHHVNAAEVGGDVVVDIAATHTPYETVLGLPPTEDQFDLEAYGFQVRRYTLPLNGGGSTVGWEQLADAGVEMPRINYRGHSTKPYRYAYGLGHSPRSLKAMNRLLKLDFSHGTHEAWYEKGCFPGEAVFVPRPGASTEDDGVVLSGVLDAKVGTSFLLVLDGQSFVELGRAAVPHHIPNDFHGQFYADL